MLPGNDLMLLRRLIREADRVRDFEEGEIPETMETLLEEVRFHVETWWPSDDEDRETLWEVTP